MMAQRFERVTPRLPVADLRRTISFYTDLLGFALTTSWPDDDPTFAILERDATTLAFFVHDEACRGPIGYA
ncbi:MAG: VOC family protein, partial [Gemmatimonadales bacterium]